ncbi:DNA-binding protein [Microbulbifer taiwanensis]|uniref:DNA-binding protein n=1 Tax=Microbulbifer taiwanensis TaxID=986746 RepID=A0ABW1YLZ1_9GAMM|nr:DNA-binding protein [Microbulbifer taiwanensis]
MRLNDFILRGSERVVHGRLRIETESLGGNTSASDRANNGIKPKALVVSLVIKFDAAEHLRELVRVVEAVDGNGKLVVYDILDDTAQAMGVRQVQFSDDFNVRQMPGQSAWRINFTLQEYLSVPEKIEQRAQAQESETQSADGQQVVDADSGEEQSQSQEYTGVEKVLKWADDALAPSAEESGATA